MEREKQKAIEREQEKKAREEAEKEKKRLEELELERMKAEAGGQPVLPPKSKFVSILQTFCVWMLQTNNILYSHLEQIQQNSRTSIIIIIILNSDIEDVSVRVHHA